jgi:hypothetical protein
MDVVGAPRVDELPEETGSCVVDDGTGRTLGRGWRDEEEALPDGRGFTNSDDISDSIASIFLAVAWAALRCMDERSLSVSRPDSLSVFLRGEFCSGEEGDGLSFLPKSEKITTFFLIEFVCCLSR